MTAFPPTQDGVRSRTVGPWFALVLYTAIALIATHPLWLHLASAVPSDIGDPLLNTWILAWDAHALLTRPLDLFQANIFYPLSNALAYSEHLLGTGLTVLPVLLFTNQPIAAYNTAFLSSFILGAWGTYLLVHRYTRHPLAAFLSGLAFAYAPYRLTAFSHLQLLTLHWLPFALLCLEGWLARRKVRFLIAFGILFWLQTAASWHLAVFGGFTVALFIVGAGFRPHLRGKPGAMLGVLSVLVLLAALIWPLVPPYLAVFSEFRDARPIEVAQSFAAQAGDFIAAPPYNRTWGKLTADLAERPGFTEENFLYPGVLTLLLALAGLVFTMARTRERPYHVAPMLTWVITLFVAIAFTWGPYGRIGDTVIALPYHWLTQVSDVFGLIRVPPRWMTAAILPLAVLAGYGGGILLGMLGRTRLLTYLVGAAVGVALLAESWSVPLPLAHVGTTDELPQVYHWLAQRPGDFAVLEWPIYVAPRPEYPETKRLYASTIHWKPLVNGYSGLTPPRQRELDDRLACFPAQRCLDTIQELGRQGVRYLIIHSLEQGFDRNRWDNIERWVLERSTTTLPVYEAEGHYIYEINPLGDALVTASATQLRPAEAPWTTAPQQLAHPAVWERGPRLLAYDVHMSRDLSYVDLYWQGTAHMDGNPTVFVHLLDTTGRIIAQSDSPPVSGRHPLDSWQTGEIVRDRHTLTPGDVPAQAGTQLRVGLYYPEAEERVTVELGPGQTADHVLLPCKMNTAGLAQ